MGAGSKKNGVLAALSGVVLIWGCASQAPVVKDTSGLLFSGAERETITRYYTAVRRIPAVAPVSAYKVGDKLVSGSRPQHLPTDLDVKLPRLKEPYTRLVVGADVVLVNRDTHDVLDVVPSVAY